jgi:hypothetical protein
MTVAFLTLVVLVVTVLVIGVQKAKKKRNGIPPEEYQVNWDNIVGESE